MFEEVVVKMVEEIRVAMIKKIRDKIFELEIIKVDGHEYIPAEEVNNILEETMDAKIKIESKS